MPLKFSKQVSTVKKSRMAETKLSASTIRVGLWILHSRIQGCPTENNWILHHRKRTLSSTEWSLRLPQSTYCLSHSFSHSIELLVSLFEYNFFFSSYFPLQLFSRWKLWKKKREPPSCHLKCVVNASFFYEFHGTSKVQKMKGSYSTFQFDADMGNIHSKDKSLWCHSNYSMVYLVHDTKSMWN